MLGIHEQVLLKIVVLVILYLKNHESSLELNAKISSLLWYLCIHVSYWLVQEVDRNKPSPYTSDIKNYDYR